MLPFVEGRREVVSDEALEAALRDVGPRQSLRRGGLERRGRHKDVVAFGTRSRPEVFPGYSWRELRDARGEWRRHGVLCHSAIEIQSTVGCAFDCTYCPYGSFVCVRLDVERFAAEVAELAMERRAQALFKLNNRADTLALEPELELAPALVETFAALEGKYLMLYAKGDAVAHLAGLDHRGKTVASFTLTPGPVAALLEVGAPPPERRLAAMGLLARSGYPVRARFSPIVPVRGWRTLYRDLVAALASECEPEMITLWTLSMIDLGDLAGIVPLEALDDDVLAAARAGAATLTGQKGGPFPPAHRAAIYREVAAMIRAELPETRVALCLETPEVWDSVGEGLTPRRGARFLCNCGPRALPRSAPRARRARLPVVR